jgi:hypothetical protein
VQHAVAVDVGVLDRDRVRHRRVEAELLLAAGDADVVPSRMKAETPRAPGVSGSVRAKRRTSPRTRLSR